MSLGLWNQAQLNYSRCLSANFWDCWSKEKVQISMIMDSSFSQDVFICPESAILYNHCSGEYDMWSTWRQKKRLLIQKAKDPEWAGLFFFFSISIFFPTGNWYEFFISIWFTNAFSYSVHFFFTVLIVSFAQKFTSDGIQFMFFPFLTIMLLVPYLRNHCQVQGYEAIHPSFLLRVLQF